MTGRKCLCLLFLVVLTFLESDAQPKQPFFRSDYTYIPTTENFYKIHHTHQRTWLEARKRCEFEGATLFYPETDSEAHDVISFWNRTQSVSWVYIGISDLVTQDVYETIDGRPIKDVYNNWGAGEPNNAGGVEDCVILRRDGTLNDDRCDRQYPFICKKTAKSVQWNKECNMPNPEYVYNEALGHCYKFHELPTNWTEALSVCSAEQSYLAIINSKAEDEFFVKMTKNAKKDNAPGLTISGAVYLGFHNRDGGGWRTIKGQPLADTGFGQWTGGQPDGGTSETCGSMFFTGELNDIGCHHRLFYICEHDVQNPSGPLDERFNYLV